MKIAYGTYAMPTLSLEEALPALAEMGYDGVEIFIGAAHVGAMPDQIDAARREQLRHLLKINDLGLPALMLAGGIYQPRPEDHQANLEHVRVCAQLGHDLGINPPVLATGFGGRRDDWDDIKHDMVQLLDDYAQVAEQEDFILAGEAHCSAAVDRSERIIWLLDTVNHPRVRLHFDIVHLFLAGEPIQDAVRALVPYTAHTHITDACRHDDGTFEFRLLGQGELDATTYVGAMYEAGWDDFITLEVSGMVWSQQDYDPIAAARLCYEALTAAFQQAGVPRG